MRLHVGHVARKQVSRERGLTLLEVVVSLAILVVALGVLYPVYQTGISRSDELTYRSHALAVARSALSGSAAKAEFENEAGVSGAVEWEVAYRPKPVGDLEGRQWQLYEVEVTVWWTYRDARESMSFASMRLGPSQPVR